VPKIVRHRLQSKADAAHPDANLLVAFAEKSVDSKEELHVLRHLAQCADCRQTIVLAQPEIEDVMEVKRLPATPSGFHRMRWAFWAAAVLAVGGMLMLNDREQTAPKQIAEATPPAQTIVQVAPVETTVNEAAASDSKAAIQPEQRKSAEVSSLGRLEATTPAAQNSPAGNGASATRDALASNAPAPRSAFAPDAKADANRVAVNATVFSKTSGPRWTLTPDGVLQRSLDSGKTWEAVSVADNANFRVVSALGSDIWVGGTAGALYHSKDAGQHWEQVKPTADGNTLNADVTALEFSDAEHGKVSTASGIWATSDAGQTWQKQ
jgi:ligand-binding sensor domain-containing protein